MQYIGDMPWRRPRGSAVWKAGGRRRGGVAGRAGGRAEEQVCGQAGEAGSERHGHLRLVKDRWSDVVRRDGCMAVFLTPHR